MTTYTEFLANHKADAENGKPFTHTRIGDKTSGIYPASYHIPEHDLKEFYSLYYDWVFVKGNKEYLTEKQAENSSMFVDFDFRYTWETEDKQYNLNDISDIICVYLDCLKKVYSFQETQPFYVYVYEKSKVNRLEDKSVTKDGIHIQFGLCVEHKVQLEIRKMVLEQLNKKKVWEHLLLLNDWESVLDEGISKGTTNWQLYGSRKPNCDAYQLTGITLCKYDENDGEFSTIAKKVSEFDLKTNFKNLTSRYIGSSPRFEINPKYVSKYASLNKKIKIDIPTSSPTSVADTSILNDIDDVDYLLCVCIKDSMCGDQQHKEWNLIGQALKNELGDKAVEPFLKWTYQFGTENKKKEALQQIQKYIKKAPMKQKDRLTLKTIHYYAKLNSPNEYYSRFGKSKVVAEGDDADILNILSSKTDYELANYFCKKFGQNFKTIDIKKKIYKFNQNKIWEEFEYSTPIREVLSNDMLNDFKKFQEKLMNNCEDDENTKRLIKSCEEVIIKLQKTNDKNNITREILDKTLDISFEDKLNKEKFVLPIKNGKILDLKTLETRERTIEHCFSYECNANYVEFGIGDEAVIRKYFLDLFCGNDKIMQCLLDILKSCFTGMTLRYIYFLTGTGRNGKSLLFTILGRIFKKFIDVLDTKIILNEKVSSSLSTQFEKLDKCRIGYITELLETDELNNTIIKKISGGDPIDYRGLYKGNKTINPTTNLFALTNELPKCKMEQAILDRLIIIPFNNRFEVDPDFEEKMLAKSDLIFSFIMKYGNICYSFDVPEEMKVAKENYKEDNAKIDYLKDFIESRFEHVTFVKTEKIKRDDFRLQYNHYLKERGQPQDNTSHNKFSRLVKNYNIGLQESNGKTYYTGIIPKIENELDNDDEM